MKKCLALLCLLTLLAAGLPPRQGHAQNNAPQNDDTYVLDTTYNDFLGDNAFYNTYTDKRLVDIEIRWDGANEWYSAVWAPVSGTVYTLFQGSYSDWSDFFTANNSRNGRYLDVEVGYFGADKRYSAIFLENGDYYSTALHTTNSDAQFQSYLAQYQNQGLALTDFEAYQEPDGDTRFAGVWTADPNQPATVLYYNLESADVSDLINPRIGRVVDIERYESDLHNETRWALLFVMDSGGEQYQRRNDTAANISTYDGIFSDGNTHIVDVESYVLGGFNRYTVLWGDSPKALHEVPAMSGDPDPEALSSTLNTLLSNFEANGQGVVGLYAKNVRTNQSLAYRSNEPFYIASTAKIPIHIKFWREVQNGHLNTNTSIAYTAGNNNPSPWYTGHRGDSPGNPALGTDDFGSSFTLANYDSMMMDVSDNAATSILMDNPTSGLTFDGYDVNEWLADIGGVGQGWGPVTSIQDVDRAIMWQGQQNSSDAADDSFFLAPPSGLEARFRWSSWDCDGDGTTNNDFLHDADCWSELRTYYNVSTVSALPDYDSFSGHRRYYNMGLNTATPRAVALLLERLDEGALLNAANTQNAITTMTEGSPFDWYGNDGAWPNHIAVRAKGGVKGYRDTSNNRTALAVSDAAIFDNGLDDVIIAVLTEDNFRPTFTPNSGTPTGVRNGLMDPIANEVLRLLTPDLVSCAASSVSASISAGESFWIGCRVHNEGGGDALPFDIHFYISDNPTISTADTYLGSLTVDGIDGFSNETRFFNVTFPNTLAPGDYYAGWIIDAPGDIGELNENNNTGAHDVTFTVELPPPALDIEALLPDDVRLTWENQLTPCFYNIYRSAIPYQMPASLITNNTTFPATLYNQLGDPGTNYSYYVRVACGSDPYVYSGWVGEFDFALTPGS